MTNTNQLPPLPKPDIAQHTREVWIDDVRCTRQLGPRYTADQMRAYALQARAQVQGEPVAWLHWLNGPVRVFMNKDEAMMELDRLNREYPSDTDDRKMRPLILGDTAPQPAQAAQAEVTDDGLISKDRFYGDDHVQDIAHALAQECEQAELDPNDLVTVNRAKLVAIAARVLEKARAILALRPAVEPMTDEQIRSMCKQGWVFETVRQWVHVIKAHHGITAQAKKESA